MENPPYFLAHWIIAPSRFDAWANVLADNDNAGDPEQLVMAPWEIAAGTRLSFY